MSKHDAKLILALDEVPAETQAKMRAAMKRPSPFGAFVGDQLKAKTSLGWVVHSGFVTALGGEMIRAADAQVPVEAKKPRSKKAAA